MSYIFKKNPIVLGLCTLVSTIKMLILNLKYCFDIKKMFELLLVLTAIYIVIIPILKYIKKIFNNEKHNSNSNSSSCYNSYSDKRKFRNLISESSCSACNNKSSSKSSLKSSSKSSSKSLSTYIDKKKIKNILRKFKIIE